MFDKMKWLQFFADGASGGDGGGGEGAGTGVSENGDAGRTLEDLGVPHDRAERYRQRKTRTRENGTQAEPATPHPSAAQTPSPQGEGMTAASRAEGMGAEATKPATMSWDDFMEIPENKQKLQAMMSERGKQATKAKADADAAMGKINPMLELIASRYGIQPVNGAYDVDAITKAVIDDDSYYERKAEDLGVDVSVAKQLEQANMERRRAEAREKALQAEREKQERDFQLQQHFMGMQRQAADLKKMFPDFSLERELQNPEFLRRTAPESGMSVADAFYSLHHDDIMQQQAEAIARRSRADAAASIRSGVRPKENGGSAAAAVTGTPDLKKMTREERRAYIMAKYPSG